MKGKLTIMLLTIAFVMTAAVVGWSQVGFQAAMLLQSNTTATGQPIQFPTFRNQITALRAELAPGGQTGRHMHPVPTFVYVLEGELSVEADGHGAKVYKAGDAFLESVNMWHNGINRAGTPTKFLVVFSGEEGKANLVRP
ncbi:MAG: cupin domain-containing protein [bacterium]